MLGLVLLGLRLEVGVDSEALVRHLDLALRLAEVRRVEVLNPATRVFSLKLNAGNWLVTFTSW